MGKDHTIFALTAGNVNYRTKANVGTRMPLSTALTHDDVA
ncbi:50S ribosomal protein L27 [Rhizobium johnstonii]